MHVSTLHRIAPGCAGPARAASVDQAATRRTRFETRPHTISRGDTTPRGIRRRGGYHVARDAGDLDAAGRAYPSADTCPSADTSADGCADQRVGIQGAGPPRETVAGCHAACAKRHE